MTWSPEDIKDKLTSKVGNDPDSRYNYTGDPLQASSGDVIQPKYQNANWEAQYHYLDNAIYEVIEPELGGDEFSAESLGGQSISGTDTVELNSTVASSPNVSINPDNSITISLDEVVGVASMLEGTVSGVAVTGPDRREATALGQSFALGPGTTQPIALASFYQNDSPYALNSGVMVLPTQTTVELSAQVTVSIDSGDAPVSLAVQVSDDGGSNWNTLPFGVSGFVARSGVDVTLSFPTITHTTADESSLVRLVASVGSGANAEQVTFDDARLTSTHVAGSVSLPDASAQLLYETSDDGGSTWSALGVVKNSSFFAPGSTGGVALPMTFVDASAFDRLRLRCAVSSGTLTTESAILTTLAV